MVYIAGKLTGMHINFANALKPQSDGVGNEACLVEGTEESPPEDRKCLLLGGVVPQLWRRMAVCQE